jgi:hypothetical protein
MVQTVAIERIDERTLDVLLTRKFSEIAWSPFSR